MKKQHAVFLLLSAVWLLLPAYTAHAAPIPFTCEEQGYSTMVDPDWDVEWVDNDGVYFHFDDEMNMPYILAWYRDDDGRVMDGDDFLANSELPKLQENYRQNGSISFTRHGSFTAGGRNVSAADLQYHNSQGLLINLLIIVDVQDDFTVIYRARWIDEEDHQSILDGLDLLISNMQPAGQSDGTGKDQKKEEKPDDSASGVYSMSVTDLKKNENALGRCVAPEGADVSWDLSTCTIHNSFSNPCRVMITVNDGDYSMIYMSMQDYLGGVTQETPDGQYNSDYHTPMLHYMTASEYCDYFLQQFNSSGEMQNVTVVEENNYPQVQNLLDLSAEKALSEYRANETFGLLTADGAEATMCTKLYSYDYNGLPYYMAVTTTSLGVQLTANGYASYSWIAWQTEAVYAMFCPAYMLDEALTVFSSFEANTTVSDEFKAANKKMGDALWKAVRDSLTLEPGRSYCEKVLSEETETGDSYDEERFSDYIFDQNDYTLSDGRHVKVSTQYDYVYEGSDGTVYYSSSAFADTNGGTKLYPN